ncbi:MAG: tripartite tricarboxylate transporter substrate binding protein [Deltaproteobacteria bacterium]|nr:tripartite tricarboxylate transporter substrate binding protein [Deltaproteobacteria bacterium]
MGKLLGKVLALWILLAVLVGLAGVPVQYPAEAAEEYPNKPVTYTIFWPPGGRSDLVARLVTPYIEKHLGTPVVVNNNVGGAGVIGHKVVKEAKPDGYNLAQSGTTVMFQYTKPGISKDDYTWIANIYSAPFVVAVPSSSKFKSMKELVDFAKANPSKLRHGNSGTGSTTHLGSTGFGMKTGLVFTQIAYKGEGPAVIGLASGEVDLAFGPMVAFKQMVEAGKLRVLAVAGPKRLKQQPQIPTCKELGYDFNWEAWEAIFGPKGLAENKAVWPKLSAAIKKALLDPELDQKLASLGLDVEYRTGDDELKWLEDEDRETKKIIYELGLQY